MKPCRKCQKVLPLSEYHADRQNTDGTRSVCKSCAKAMQTPRTRRAAQIKRHYGISIEQEDEMWRRQKGLCAANPNHLMVRGTRNGCVDHDHATGKIRDLLCDKCNRVLGFVNDSIPELEGLIAYLKKHRNE